MKGIRWTNVVGVLLLWTLATLSARAQTNGSAFVNFETAPVHPIALSADGNTLAVCNLPDACVELFDLTSGQPRRTAKIFTGIDPVTARFNPNGELWVINHISDTISVIDPTRKCVILTLECFDAPADVIFTTNPNRAFVSHSGANLVEVWDADTHASLDAIDIEGDRPKAMALSADRSEIYIAILESGNASTIIAPPLTGLDSSPTPSVVDLEDGPHGGLNPFPNSGDIFAPIINPLIPLTNPPPRVTLIVRKQQGRWMDDNGGDWTEYVSGDKSLLTGRVPGWDVADHDLAVLKVADNSVRYIRGLMNICFDVAVNPASGQVAVIGTDAINEVRFEPNLKSIFARMKIALVDPNTSTEPTVRDLNPHLDYKQQTLPLPQRRQTVGDPRGIVWNSRGTRAYVTGMGSNNILMLDQNGERVGPAVELPEGPTGLVLDEQRNRLYVLARFASQLVVLNAETLGRLNSVPLHDPTPPRIKLGRKHFYNTIENSGLGHLACATCHVDGRFDRLAWDLGDQTGEVLAFTNRNLTFPGPTNSFHPMKGPMVTQTLQDIIGHEPFHWRGDRMGIEEFSPTFMALQGADEELTEEEMQEFKDFLASLTFPPNPNRNLDNTLPNALRTGERAFGRGSLPPGAPLPPGNASRGMFDFRNANGGQCLLCHTLPTGLGPDMVFTNNRWQTIPLGSNNEHHIGMIALRRTSELPFKIQQLRNLTDKIGFDLRSQSSRSGFGFLHDGRVDSLSRFLQDGFRLTDDQRIADLLAFLFAFTGSDLPGGVVSIRDLPPGVASKDVPAGVGVQSVQTNNTSNSRTLFMLSHARGANTRVELIAHGFKNGQPRSWLMRGQEFVANKAAETNTTTQLLALASPTQPVILTLVPLGSGTRLALDMDGDTFRNQTEIEAGSDPADPTITPNTTTPRLTSFTFAEGQVRIEWFGKIGSVYRIQTRDAFAETSTWSDHADTITLAQNPGAFSEPLEAAASARFFRIVHVP